MKKLVSTLNLDKKSWLRYRKRGIGGSDAGAVCGLNPYRTAIQVYYDKTSEEIEEIDNEAMRQGRELEEYVARRFCEASGKKVRRANALLYDEKNPFMLADVDRMIVGENAGLECKTASPYMADQWKEGSIPVSYQIQCYHYMAVCGVDAWYIAVLIYGREFKYYRIERDDEVIENLIRIEKEFWNNHVLSRVMPHPDGSKTADLAIAERFQETQGTTILLSGFDERLRRRQELLAVMEHMETEKRQIDQELKLYLGNAETAENEHYRVSWKNVSRSSLDEKRLKEEEPEIYEKYRRITTSRRFTVKAA
ncbi:YqaJ viral recombinase family protein [Mediterraneibacter glycyrrhizinilyticus]|uniref:lambda-exonuclease family protein n=1 Tax=Mediterraneibacter glycyrrhizinilyticus TaxID=342942 RepID=UPI001960D18E|nr:YqaJ viral recombinase family protein [Mediterraneibacter glycyrrhizinilyticus]MBM6753051.1 YqaJ viral recombinase family protein [Mediterraneibacter glycyrrhizinilyticus]